MISKVITFLVGFVGGCTFGGLYFKSKYEKLADAEIKDMMDWYEARLNKTEETVEEKKDMEEIKTICSDNGYVVTDVTPKKKTTKPKKRKTYPGISVISPEEFNSQEDDYPSYDVSYLTLYSDGTLVRDSNYSKVEDVDSFVGIDNLKDIGKFEADILHIRNDNLSMFYEISYVDSEYDGE